MKERKVSKFKFIVIVIGILFYLIDVGSDIHLSAKYYENGSMTYCTLTIILVILSAVTTTSFSWHMYFKNRLSNDSTRHFDNSTKHWIIRSIFLTIGLAPVLKNIEAFSFAWRSYHCKNNYHLSQKYARSMVYEIKNGSFLRLFEAFIESGPQLVLQIYIFAVTQSLNPNVFTATEFQQCRIMLISCCSVAFAVISYLSSQRESSDSKNELKLRLYPSVFLWRFFEVISRVLVMGLIISVHPLYLLVFIIHFSAMTLWVHSMKTDFCDNWCSGKLYDMLLGVILTFCYFNPSQKSSKLSFAIFYGCIFFENCVLLGIWFYFCPTDLNYRLPAAVLQVSSFCLSIVFMIIYYKFFHPTVVKQRTNQRFLKSKELIAREKNSIKKINNNIVHNGIEIVKKHISSKSTQEIHIQNGEGAWESADSKNNSKHLMQNVKATRENAGSKNSSKHPMQNDKAAEKNSNVKKEQNSKELVKKCISNKNISETHTQNGKGTGLISHSKTNPVSKNIMLDDKLMQENTDSKNTSLTKITKFIVKGRDAIVKKYMPISQIPEIHMQNGKGVEKKGNFK